jgi:hypothetical protein
MGGLTMPKFFFLLPHISLPSKGPPLIIYYGGLQCPSFFSFCCFWAWEVSPCLSRIKPQAPLLGRALPSISFSRVHDPPPYFSGGVFVKLSDLDSPRLTRPRWPMRMCKHPGLSLPLHFFLSPAVVLPSRSFEVDPVSRCVQ